MNGNEKSGLARCWVSISEESLEQGDLLRNCLYRVTFSPNLKSESVRTDLAQSDLIIVSQSCDIVADRMPQQIALCPIFHVEKLQAEFEQFRKKGVWNEVKRGRRLGYYLLQCPEDPNDTQKAIVVDFRQIISLPSDYVVQRAREMGERWRLTPPQREHFSQAFGVYFMRVALPETLPDFK
ncbi:MAG: hypothetical protein ACHQNE_01615 [Candidatus Kapaibacterium sp.]